MSLSATNPPQGTIRDWIDHRATDTPTTIAFSFTDGTAGLTWLDLQSRARIIASDLDFLGLTKGESVAIMMPNCRAAVEALFGVMYGGFRATLINLAAGEDAIAYALDHCEARRAFVGQKQIDVFNRVKPRHLERVGEGPLQTIAVSDGSNNLSPSDDALLMYTSGTTGTPKGVVHTHASLLAGGWTTAVAHELSPQDVGFCVLPICHINGLCVTVISTLISGGSLVMAPKFSTSRFWQDVSDHRVTWFSVVPTIISHLLHGASMPDPTDATRLRFGRSASSALAPDVQSAFENRFGIPIIETMGMTETAAQLLSNPLPPGVRKIGSPGIPFGNQVDIFRADGTPAPAYEQGEIVICGPNVMKGYLKNPAATAATFAPGGWLRSGDLGHKDDDGFIFVTGRLKELIIKGGENIAPREIDEALYSHKDVVEAAAFARPCKTYGERVEAAVSLCPGSVATTNDLIDICTTKVGAFKCPDHIHVLDELPKGPSGKIQRLKLAEILDQI